MNRRRKAERLDRSEFKAEEQGALDAYQLIDQEFDRHCLNVHGGVDHVVEVGCETCDYFLQRLEAIENELDKLAAAREVK